MRIFITGATGFVGGAIAASLSQDHEIRAMSRSEGSDAKLRAAGVEPVRCALGAVDAAHLAGCDVVIHCAAFVGPWGSRADYWSANVDGTQQLLEAARAAGVRRFIHMGTEAGLFYGQDMIDIDESYPTPESTPYLYSETKAEAERRVIAMNGPQLETLVLRPRLVWGPGDTSVLPELLRMVEGGQFAWIDHGAARTSTTYIFNLVRATELALTRGRPGQVYFITDGEDTTAHAFLTALLATRGVRPSERSMPRWLASGAAWLVEGVWRMLGLRSTPPVMRFPIDAMGRSCTIRIDRARAELGYEPVATVAEGLQATARAAEG